MKPSDLQQWRAKAGFSQEELAEKLGVHSLTVSRWELGKREIPSYLSLALKTIERDELASKKKTK